MLAMGVVCEEVEVAAAGGAHWVSDAGVVTCPEHPDSSTMHLDGGGDQDCGSWLVEWGCDSPSLLPRMELTGRGTIWQC